MGGFPPLGYDVGDRKLAPHPSPASNSSVRQLVSQSMHRFELEIATIDVADGRSFASIERG